MERSLSRASALSLVISVLESLIVVAAVVMGVAEIAQLSFGWMEGTSLTASLGLVVYGFAGLAMLVCALASGVCFLIWLVCALNVVRHVNKQPLRISPEWAVLSFFVPIVFLFVPLQAIQQIWKGTHPERVPENWQVQSGRSAILVWWLFCIANQVAARLLMVTEAITWLDVASAVLVVGVSLGTIWLVRDLSRRLKAAAQAHTSDERVAFSPF